MKINFVRRRIYPSFRVLFAVAVCLPLFMLTTVALSADPPEGKTQEQARQKGQPRLISLVLLLGEPRKLDEHTLANAVSKALGIAQVQNENASTFVVAKPPYYLIKLESERFVVNNIAEPYFRDPDKLAKDVKDLELSKAIEKNRAWLSVDWVEKEGTPDLKSVYQQIGKMAAALAGPDTLAVYNPDTDGLSLWNAALAKRLKGDDPLESFVSAAPNLISISADDPRLKAAEAEAEKQWPEFVRAFKEKSGDQFAVKGRIIEGENAEYMWLSVTGIDEKLVHGTLANAPANLKGLKLGQDLHIKIGEVDDWLYIGPDKRPHGGFTQKVLRDAAKSAGVQDNSKPAS